MPQYQGIWTLAQAAQLQSTQRWATDPLFENTTLLLQADNAANGAQNNTFLDSSSNNFTITRNGNTTQGSFTPFSLQPGAWSNFASAASASVGFSNATAALVGSTASTFTAECWIYMTDAPVSGDGVPALIGMDATFNSSIYLGFGPNASQKLVLRWFDGASKTATGSTTLALNTWYHIAVVANSNALAMYVNGVPEVLTGTTTLTNRNATTNTFSLFLNSSGSNYQFRGYASNIRVCTSAVYTSAFTPSPLPLTTTSQGATNCRLLTCQDNRFIDNSSNAYVLTLQSTPSVQAFSPFAPQYQYTPSVTGGSGYFDGTGDYLTAAGNAAFAFGTGDFTVAAWIYPTNAQRITILSSNYTYVTGAGNWSLYFDVGSAQTLYFNSQSGNKASTVTTTIPLNAWTHVAYTRVGTTGRFFVNGVQLGANISDSFNYGGGTGTLFVGQQNDGNALMLGYMSGIQVLKGTGYSTLPIPTAPLTAITNTSLLLNFTNAGIVNGTMKNNLETVGNAQVSTSVVKYGTGSMAFDGTGDWLQAPSVSNQLFTLGTGNFTVECWFYRTSTSGRGDLLGTYAATPTGWGLGTSILATADIVFYIGNTVLASTAGSVWSAATWTHVAVVRLNGNLRIYVNGVSQASVTDTTNLVVGSPLQVGAAGNSTQAYNGYIDDLRITTGIARYTANFTPPTVALPRQ